MESDLFHDEIDYTAHDEELSGYAGDDTSNLIWSDVLADAAEEAPVSDDSFGLALAQMVAVLISKHIPHDEVPA